MTNEIQKVIAYITNGRRLLLFRHMAYPEAGIQVPGGTVEPGESLPTAVMREAQEETGLDRLHLVDFLGTEQFIMEASGKDGSIARHFFHLHFPDRSPERWRHLERFPSEGEDETIEFELYWAAYPDEVPSLAGGQDALLTKIPWDSLPQ